MVIMGLTPGVSVVAWTITYLLIFSVVTVITVALLKSSMLPNSDASLLFVYIIVFYACEVSTFILVVLNRTFVTFPPEYSLHSRL